MDCRKCEYFKKIFLSKLNNERAIIDRVQTVYQICFHPEIISKFHSEIQGAEKDCLVLNPDKELKLNQSREHIVSNNYAYEHCPLKISKEEKDKMLECKDSKDAYHCNKCDHGCQSYNNGETFAVSGNSGYIWLKGSEYAPCGLCLDQILPHVSLLSGSKETEKNMELDCRKCDYFKYIGYPCIDWDDRLVRLEYSRIKSCTHDNIVGKIASKLERMRKETLIFDFPKEFVFYIQVGNNIIASNYKYEHCPLKKREGEKK